VIAEFDTPMIQKYDKKLLINQKSIQKINESLKKKIEYIVINAKPFKTSISIIA
jgi:hypothetical protein